MPPKDGVRGMILFWLAIALLAVFAVLLLVSYVQARLLLRPRRTPPRATPDAYALDMLDVRIPSARGVLAGWYLPARNGCTLICCHGIHDNGSQWLEPIARLHERGGYGAVLFDFAGHGASDDGLLTYGAHEVGDVAAVVEYLRERGDVDMTRVGIMGYSLGAITAVLAAAELPDLRAVVVESGFADVMRDVSKLFTRLTHLPPFPLANLTIFWGERLSGARLADLRPVTRIGSISPRPVLIISDLGDQLADEPYDGEQLYAHAGEPKEFWQVPDVPHVGAYAALPDEWVRRVGDFLDRSLSPLSLAGADASLPAPSPSTTAEPSESEHA